MDPTRTQVEMEEKNENVKNYEHCHYVYHDCHLLEPYNYNEPCIFSNIKIFLF